MLRFLTAGESHGPALTAIIEGYPAGVPFDQGRIDCQLRRRQSCAGRGDRMKIEQDRVELLSGVRNGVTLGSPITLLIRNKDWVNWQGVMSAAPEQIDPEQVAARCVTRPRPGHADLAGAQKYRYQDLRNVLERASARETAARVAVGSVARILLETMGIHLFAHVVQIGLTAFEPPVGADLKSLEQSALTSPVFCVDPQATAGMVREIEAARDRGDTLGGIFEVVVTGLPPGLGSHVHYDRRLDAALTAALISIPAVKGVEIGLGFRGAELPGSTYHDPISYEQGRGFYRMSNNAGGLEGGMSNGESLVLRSVVKPVPTLRQPLPSVNFFTKEVAEGAVERSDVCIVPAAAVVGEAMTAWILACAILDKFGGDSLVEIQQRFREYQEFLIEV